MKNKIDFIDFAKGFAILSIVFFHYCQPYAFGLWSHAIEYGGAGVHLFIVLSAFGLGLAKKISPINFYKRRFVKILMPYYFVVIIIFATNQIYPIYQGTGIYALCGHIFLFKMFDESIIGSFGYHFWFLSTIIQFYLMYPLLTYFKNITNTPIFLSTTFSISVLYWILISVLKLSEDQVFHSFFLNYLWEFCIGMTLSDIYLFYGKKFWQQNYSILVILTVSGIFLETVLALKGGNIGRTFNDIPASIGYTSLCIIAYSICSKRLLSIKNIMIYVGKVSFELYLIHIVIFILVHRVFIQFLKSSNIFISLLIYLPIALLFSWMLNLLLSTVKVAILRDRTT